MGRFYKTSKSKYVKDNIYTPPWELMAKVINNADTQIKENETALLSLYDKLKAESLAVDKPRLQSILGNYENQIENLVSKIQENPLEFRKKTGAIRNLGRQIHNDWTRGEVSAIQNNKKTYDDWLKRHLTKIKAKQGYVTQDDVNYAKGYFLNNFTKGGGTKYNNGVYNSIDLEDLNPFVNLEDLGEKRAKGYIADVLAKHGAYTDGKYMYTSENKTEYVPFNTIKQGVLSSMINDKELMSYYEQQVRLGRLNKDDVAKKLELSADRVAKKYSYTKQQTGKKSIKGDPYGLESQRQHNRINLEKVKQKNKLALDNYKDKIKSANIITGPGENVLWATREQQLEWDNQTFDQLERLANITRIDIDSTDPIDVILKMRREYLQRFSIAKRTNKSQAVLNEIQNNLKQLDNIDGFYNNGKGIASWVGMAEGIDAVTNNQYDGTRIAANTKKTLQNYAKNGAMNNVPFYIRQDGQMIKTTINQLIKQGKIVNEKDVVIINSFMPTWNNLDPDKQHLNQIDFKIKLKGGATDKLDNDGNVIYNTEVIPVKSTFSDFQLNFYK